MGASTRAGPNSRRSFFFSALVLSLLTACATAQVADEASSADGTDIGYGEVDKDQLSGSVSTVEGDDESAPRFRSLAEMLSRVPGVRVTETPNGGMSVRIRGASSFLGGEDPLFILDGMAMPSSAGVLRTLNPNDIDSITVLKDPGETAVYGSRGANGVILIKMKKR